MIVNEEFAKAFFNGENPVGKTFEATWAALKGQRIEIVGLVRDARYRYLKQDMLPVVYTEFSGWQRADAAQRNLRRAHHRCESVDPRAFSSRQEVSRERSPNSE